MSSTPNPTPTPAQRFGLVILGLLRSVSARARPNLLTGGCPEVGMARLPERTVDLIYARFRLAGRLFAALAERVRLGTARTYPNRASPRIAPPTDASPGAAPASGQPAPGAPDSVAPERLPRGFGAVTVLLQHLEARHYVGQLRLLLADPEMVGLLQSAPGFARIVRPLCRMLGITPPPDLFPPLPRRPRRSRPRPETPLAPPRESACLGGARKAGGGAQRTDPWVRPRPAAWETRLEASLAVHAQKTR